MSNRFILKFISYLNLDRKITSLIFSNKVYQKQKTRGWDRNINFEIMLIINRKIKSQIYKIQTNLHKTNIEEIKYILDINVKIYERVRERNRFDRFFKEDLTNII